VTTQPATSRPSAADPTVVNPLQASAQEATHWADRPHDHFAPPADRHHRLVGPRQWRVPLSRSPALVGASREPRHLYELFRAHRRVASEVGLGLLGPAARVVPRYGPSLRASERRSA